MNAKDYREWQQKLIETAVMDYMYAYAVIEPLVAGHAFQKYYDDDKTPLEAIQEYRNNND